MAVQPGLPKCHDAIVVVPGILGSELRDVETDELVWGLAPKPLAKALVTGNLFDQLRQRELRPGGLLGYSGSLPFLSRFEPYTRLVRGLEQICTHRDAVKTYPYDWRQPVSATAPQLAADAMEHLEAWRGHPQGNGEARLIFVAHSMGGLLAWHASNVHLDPADIALVITLGTPFGGSVKALRALAPGDLLPFGWRAAKLQACAREMGAVHDLLPSYPCLTEGETSVRPTPGDLISCGADPSLLDDSISSRLRLEERLAVPAHRLPLLVPLVGTRQQTLQSFTNHGGELHFHEHLDQTNWRGDGTVYFGAAYPIGHQVTTPLPQQHGALASSNIAIGVIEDILLGIAPGPPQGDGIGLTVPDIVHVNETFEVRIDAPTFAGVACTHEEPGVKNLGKVPLTQRTDDLDEPEQHGRLAISQPGLYTVIATGGGYASIKCDVLVLPSDT